MEVTKQITKTMYELHGGDLSQIDVIESPDNIIVEAPAGFGKTRTMVSRIAFQLATKQILPPKKILVLSFSVNAASKIKQEVFTNLPRLLSSGGSTDYLQSQVSVSNYHGFCKSFLRAHGHVLDHRINDIDNFKVVDDNHLGINDSYDADEFLQEFDARLKAADIRFVYQNNTKYAQHVISALIPHGIITYNGLLSIAIYLLNEHETIRHYYNELYRSICVDEIQDTNALALWLLSLLITDDQRISFFGDSNQQVYRFIGAIPNIIGKIAKRFNLTTLGLKTNYRFKANSNLQLLEENIRSNCTNPKTPEIEDVAYLNLYRFDNQLKESSWITKMAIDLSASYPEKRVSILVKQRKINTDTIVNQLVMSETPFFYGLFTDDSEKYKKFHDDCLIHFVNLEQDLCDHESVGKSFSKKHIQLICDMYKNDLEREVKSFLELLSSFWKNLLGEKHYLSKQERIEYCYQVFSNYSLKRFIDNLDTNLSINTIHASKGLEWDFVILADVEQFIFPFYKVCNTCHGQRVCDYDVENISRKEMFPELSLFYVGITRAKEEIFVTCSDKQLQTSGNEKAVNPSCLLFIPGVQLNCTRVNVEKI